MADNRRALKAGNAFKSFSEFQNALHAHQEENFVLYVNKNSALHSNKEKKYSTLYMRCKQGGTRRDNPKATGQRPTQSSYRTGCNAFLYLAYSKRSDKLVLKKFDDTHNHPCTLKTYSGYPEIRKLSAEGKTEAVKLQKLHVLLTNIRPELKISEDMPGGDSKIILGRDLANAKAKYRKDLLGGRSEEEMVEAELQRIKKKDPQACTRIDFNPQTKKLNFILIQTSDMRRTFNLFPEVLITDITYRINKNRLPVSVMEVMDGNGEGRVVGYAFLCNEQKDTLTNMFLALVESVGQENMQKVQTCVVDKDYSEIVALRHSIPNAMIHLCLKHADANFKTAVAKEDNKDECLAAMRGMLHSRSQEIFDEHLRDFKEMASKDLRDYFDTNWLQCKEAWSLKDRLMSLTLRNFTTNRVESHNRKIKIVLNADATVAEAIHGLVDILDSGKQDHLRYRDHVSLTKVFYTIGNSNKLLDNAANDLTQFAFKHVRKQLEQAERESAEPELYDTTTESCSCVDYLSLLLPCRHIMRVRHAQGLDMYTKDIVIERWHKMYNVDSYEPDQAVPAGNGLIYVPRVPQTSQKPLSAATKFKKLQEKSKELLKELNSVGSDCGTRAFHQRLQVIDDLVIAWKSGREVALVHLSDGTTNQGKEIANKNQNEIVIIDADENSEDISEARGFEETHSEVDDDVSDTQEHDGSEEENDQTLLLDDIKVERCTEVIQIVEGGTTYENNPPVFIDLTSDDENATSAERGPPFILPVVRTKGRYKDKFNTQHTGKKGKGQSIQSTFRMLKPCGTCKNGVAGRYICGICKCNVHASNPCSDLFKEVDDRPGKVRICRTCQEIYNEMGKWECNICTSPLTRFVTASGRNRGRSYLGCRKTTHCKGFVIWEPSGEKFEQCATPAPQPHNGGAESPSKDTDSDGNVSSLFCDDEIGDQLLSRAYNSYEETRETCTVCEEEDSDMSLLLCSNCQKSMHCSDLCSIPTFDGEVCDTPKRVCLRCYCRACRKVKESNHLCICKCCSAAMTDSVKCVRCLVAVCAITCCEDVSESDGMEKHICSDCRAAELSVSTLIVKDIVEGKRLSDQHLTKVAALMHDQFHEEVGGLTTPLQVKCGEAISKDSLHFYPKRCKEKDYTQIVNTGRDHWVTVAIKKGSSSIYVLDSCVSVGVTGLTKIQMAMIMKSEDAHIPVVRPYVKQQKKGNECGLFAIANAVEFAINRTLSFVDFDESQMRDHLYNCLSDGVMTLFPRLSNRKKKVKVDDDTLILKVTCTCRLPECFCDMVQCDGVKCGKYFHTVCVGVKEVEAADNWYCEKCKGKN